MNYENIHQAISSIKCNDAIEQQQPNMDGVRMCDTDFKRTSKVSHDLSHNHIDGMNTYNGLVVYQNARANENKHSEDAHQSLK